MLFWQMTPIPDHDIQKPSLRDPSHGEPWAPPSYVAEGGHRFLNVTVFQFRHLP